MRKRFLLFIFVLILISLACSFPLFGQGLENQSPEVESTQGVNGDIIEPGGTFVSSEGVKITAPEGAISESAEINIQSIETPTDDTPLPTGVEVVGSFYEMNANQDVYTSEGYLVIGLPLEERQENLAIAVLVPESYIDDQAEDESSESEWSFVDGFYDQENELLLGAISLLPQESFTVAIVSSPRFETQDAQNTQSNDLDDSQQLAFLGFPQVDAPSFEAVCSPEFDDPSVSETCGDAEENTAAAELENAYYDFTGIGFKLPRLYRKPETIVSSKNFTLIEPGPYLIELKPCSSVSVLGRHNSATKKIWACIPTDGINATVIATIRHEYFHSTQYAYDNVLNGNRQSWVIEAQAAASENSLATYDRSSLRAIRFIDIGFHDNSGDFEYEVEDFWIYQGMKLNRGFEYVGEVLTYGANADKVDAAFQNIGLSNLASAYWDWVKNQAFEKQVDLGRANSNNTCELSTDSSGAYYVLGSNPPKVSFQLESPPPAELFSLEPLQAKVIEIEFNALPSAPYQTVVTVESDSSMLRSKFYRKTPSTPTDCWTNPDSKTLNAGVNAGQDVTFYALLANTSSTESINGNLVFEQETGLSIVSPDNSSIFEEGQSIPFTAVAVGPGNRAGVDLNIYWEYERYDGVPTTIGSSINGEVLSYASFCDGTYTVTARGIDATFGDYGTDTVTFTVTDLGSSNPPSQCSVSIDIVEPVNGTSLSPGQTVDLRAVIDDDHPETNEPLYPVIWYANGTTGTIIGRGLTARTKIPDTLTSIVVVYGAAQDSISISIVEDNNPPRVVIQSPDDGDFFQMNAATIPVDFVAAALDQEDLNLSDDIEWSYREVGTTGGWTEAGFGSFTTINFIPTCDNKSYEVRALVKDSEGAIGQDEVTITVRGPEC